MSAMRLISLQPTVFFVRDDGVLRQVVLVTLQSGDEPVDASLLVRAGDLE